MSAPQRQAPPERPAGLPAGRYFGVPVYFSPSWFLFAGFITISWADVVQNNVGQITRGQSYAVAFGFAVLLAISVLAHELGHAVVSIALGLKVRRIVLFLLGGVSEIEREPERPVQEYLVAVAGPLVSLILAGAGAAGYSQLASNSVERWLVVQLMLSNLGVMIFNMLPGLPLDGGRLLRAGVWALTNSQLSGTRAAAWGGRAIAVALVIGALALQRSEQGAELGSLLIALLLALFIWVSAGQALRVATLRTSVPRLNVADLIRSPLSVAADLSVAEAVRRAQEVSAGGLVVVDGDGHARAVVSELAVLGVPEARRPWTPVTDVARPLEPGLVLRDTLGGEALLDAMRGTPASEYLVVGRTGDTVGVLVAADVARALDDRAGPPIAGSGPWGAPASQGGPR